MKKPDIMVALGMGKPENDDMHDGGDESVSPEDHEDAKIEAANALIEAVHSRDAEGVVQALSTMHDLCANPPPDMPKPEEDDQSDEDGSGDEAA